MKVLLFYQYEKDTPYPHKTANPTIKFQRINNRTKCVIGLAQPLYGYLSEHFFTFVLVFFYCCKFTNRHQPLVLYVFWMLLALLMLVIVFYQQLFYNMWVSPEAIDGHHMQIERYFTRYERYQYCQLLTETLGSHKWIFEKSIPNKRNEHSLYSALRKHLEMQAYYKDP